MVGTATHIPTSWKKPVRANLGLDAQCFVGNRNESESPVSPFQLCETIGYHTIEIFNAQFGSVYDLELLALLPPGLTIIPGTSEMSYPTGSTFQTVADPVLVNSDTAFYDLSAMNPTLGDLGLLGFANAPDHSVTIRFKAASSCGFVSPSQIIFNASAVQGCGLDANNLRQAKSCLSKG
ncbi:MAG: hypothetical protein R2788_05250 [Saprospiraceae bacterium]